MSGKKIEPEKQGEGEQFEQAPMGGDVKIGKKSGDRNKNVYYDLIREMRDVADSIVFENPKTKNRTMNRTIKDQGKPRYIDSMISARSVFAPSDGSGEVPAIYVHTYAVQDIEDPRGERGLEMKSQVGGYIIQGGLPAPVTLFIDSPDHAAVQKYHAEIVRMSELLTLPTAEAIFTLFLQRHETKKKENGEQLFYIIDRYNEAIELADPSYESPHEQRYPVTKKILL